MKQLGLHIGVFAGVALLLPVVFGSYGIYLGCALCVWASFALAYDIAFGRAGLVSFGHAIMFGVGAFAFALALADLNLSFWPALAMAVLAATLISMLLGAIALRVTGHAFVIITVILGGIVELVAISSQSITRGEDGRTFDLAAIDFGLFSVSLLDPFTRYAVFLAGFLFVYLCCWWMGRSSIGLVLSAIRQNERRSALLGYRTKRYKFIALTVSGALSGFAGALFSLLNSHVTAEVFQITVSIQPLTAALVGGAGTILGPVVGTALVFTLSDLLRTYVVYADALVGVVLIATVLLAPKGLVGSWNARRERLARSNTTTPTIDERAFQPAEEVN